MPLRPRPLPCLRRALTNAARTTLPAFVDVASEVQHALHTGAPVVALESTIITHGMPYPTNISTALSVESIVRSSGAVPATIAIVQGRVKVGMDRPQLERLVQASNDGKVVKVSRRDVGPVVALRKDGGTTCSATLIFAALAGFKVFATGGLGGVHRGGEISLDISADLHELTRCPVGLVSAGVKSILDIGRTLEYLETLGVPVLTYGDTNDFPAFYSPKSGFKSSYSVNDPISAARVLHAQSQLSMSTGALFAAPIPASHHAAAAKIQEAVEQAVRESEENGVNRLGKEATPWLLKRVGELTGGSSLESNVALIENTAKIGAQIAVAYADLVKEQEYERGIPTISTSQPSLPYTSEISSSPPAGSPASNGVSPVTNPNLSPPPPPPSAHAPLVVLGASAIDITAHPLPTADTHADLQAHSTSPGSVALSLGGVGRNVAEAAFRLLPRSSPDAVALVSPVGRDAFGRLLVEEQRRMGMRVDGLIEVGGGQRTAVCDMVMDTRGGLVGGVADMDVVRALDGERAVEALERFAPRVVAVDANLMPETVTTVVGWCRERGVKTFFEPTSITKSTAILPAIAASMTSISPQTSPVTFASPNLLELTHLYQTIRSDPYDLTSHPTWWQTLDAFSIGSEFRLDIEHLSRRRVNDSERTLGFLVDDGIAQMAINLLPFFQHLIVKCGDLGVIVVMRTHAAASPAWEGERSNIHVRCIVAHGKSDAGEIVVLKHFPAASVDPRTIANVTGAGDSLVGSILSSLVRNPGAFEDPRAMDEVVDLAQRSAALTLQSADAVSPLLSDVLHNT